MRLIPDAKGRTLGVDLHKKVGDQKWGTMDKIIYKQNGKFVL